MKKNYTGDKGILDEIREKNEKRNSYYCAATRCPCLASADIRYLLNRIDAAERAAKKAMELI